MDFDVLVNGHNKLPLNYVPNDLVLVPNSLNYMYQERLSMPVCQEFLRLQQYAKREGLNIYVSSGYRSAILQLRIYFYNLRKTGIENTRKKVAVPGASEHQTGLALDLGIMECGHDKNITLEESNWLASVSPNYGLILRYPLGKENITGFSYEPWHFRYVGSNLAKYLFNNKMTLEEYYIEKNDSKKLSLKK